MKLDTRRAYRQTARAEAAELTRRRIMDAAYALWRDKEWEEVTLAELADSAGVTAQTVLRKFGAKDGVLEACIGERASEIEAKRAAPVGDLAGALEVLLAHYEADGDDVLLTLDREHRSTAAKRVAEHGRTSHRAWCARVFAPWLPSGRGHAARLDAFVAATDLYLWKLLRRDLGRSAAQTRRALTVLLEGLTTKREEDAR